MRSLIWQGIFKDYLFMVFSDVGLAMGFLWKALRISLIKIYIGTNIKIKTHRCLVWSRDN